MSLSRSDRSHHLSEESRSGAGPASDCSVRTQAQESQDSQAQAQAQPGGTLDFLAALAAEDPATDLCNADATQPSKSTSGPSMPAALVRAIQQTTVTQYRCGYCRKLKTSSSTGGDGRVRIRCECGGKHRDSKPRMHAMWLQVSGSSSPDVEEPLLKRHCAEEVQRPTPVSVTLVPAKNTETWQKHSCIQTQPPSAIPEQSGQQLWVGNQALVTELQRQLKAKTEEMNKLEGKLTAAAAAAQQPQPIMYHCLPTLD